MGIAEDPLYRGKRPKAWEAVRIFKILGKGHPQNGPKFEAFKRCGSPREHRTKGVSHPIFYPLDRPKTLSFKPGGPVKLRIRRWRYGANIAEAINYSVLKGGSAVSGDQGFNPGHGGMKNASNLLQAI